MRSVDLNVVRRRRADLARQIATLQAEERDLATAERVLGKLLGTAAEFDDVSDGTAKPERGKTKAAPDTRPKKRRSRASTRKSQRQLVLDELAAAPPGGYKTADLIEAIRKRSGVTIAQKTLSPLLSVMKKDAQIVRLGRVILPSGSPAPLDRRKTRRTKRSARS